MNNIRHAPRTIRGRLGDHFLERPVQLRRHIRTQFRQVGDGRGSVPDDLAVERQAVNGRLTNEQEVERVTEAVDIRPMIHLLRIHRLFGSHVAMGSEGRAVARQLMFFLRDGNLPEVGQTGQSQVGNLDHPARSQQQITRLDVAMDDAFFVGVLKTASRLERVVHRKAKRQRTMPIHTTVQITPADVLHRHVTQVGRDFGIVRPNNVGVRQIAARPNFASKTANAPFGVEQPRAQDFHGHDAVHAQLHAPIHAPHAARSNLIQQDEFAVRNPWAISLPCRLR